MFSRSFVWRLTAILCAVIFVWGALRYAGHQLDDTFISFRYARNLVEGHGLVFNPGERVEGFTNLLFVMASAVFLAVGLAPITGALLLTAASGLACLLLTTLLVREVMLFSWCDAATVRRGMGSALCLLMATEGFAYWSMVGMETMLFAALLAAATLLLIRESRTGRGHLSAAAFILLALTRPEGAYAAAVALAASFGLERWRHGDFREARRLMTTAAITGAGVAALFAWRFVYYGSLLPNTFHAKVTGGDGQIPTGLTYLKDWALSSPLPALALLAPLTLLSSGARRRLGRGNPVWLLWALGAAFALNAVGVGGDSMPFFRFMVHMLPLACALAVVAAEGALPGLFLRHGLRGAVVPALLLGTAVISHLTVQPYRAFVAHRTAVVGRAVGEWFGESLPEGSLMAVNTIGTLPWASRLPTVDMLGLTDAAIARRPVYVSSTGWAGHRRGWGAYVLSRRPAAILWYNSAGSSEPFYLGDRELADDPWFRFFYRHRIQRISQSVDTKGSSGTSGSSAERLRDEAAGDDDREGQVRRSQGTGPVIARFPGRPFGFHPSGASVAPELGIRAEFTGGLVPMTLFRESPILVHWFEPDPRDAGLWNLRRAHAGRIGPFVDAVAATWRKAGTGSRPFDPESRTRVEAMCEEALARVEAGALPEARKILTRAAAANGQARSPQVYQYMANLAVMTGDLLAALPAQKEALRLAPGNRLYAENLKRLLRQPWEEATESNGSGGEELSGSGG